MFISLVGNVAKNIALSKKIDRARMLKAVIKRDTAGIMDCVGGNVIRDIMQPIDSKEAEFDIKKYSPFLNKVTAAIREITKNGIVMMEQSYICNTGIKQSAPPITVNGEREPLQCFGPHAYDFTVDTPLYQYANADRVKAFFEEMHNTQKRLDVPCIVGEWGGCSNNQDTSWFPHAFELLDFFDEKQWGQSYWTYQGNDLDSPLMTMLSRTHPVAVAGDIKSYGYNRDENVFTLNYIADKEGESIIYVHKPFTAEGTDFSVIEEYENGASLISVKANEGENTVKIRITD